MEDNFLVQVTDGPTRGEALLAWCSPVRRRASERLRLEAALGCSDHALVEFVILKNAGLTKSRARTLCFRRAKFQLLKELLSGMPWETVLKGMGAEQS